MAGTSAGGKLAAQKNLANDPDFYKKIGSTGGSRRVPKGFAIDRELASEAGRKGGLVSRRKPEVKELGEPIGKRKWSELVYGKAYKKQYKKEDV